MFENGIQVMRADRRGTVYGKFLYTSCQTQLFSPQILVSHAHLIDVFCSFSLDISKNKSWILQSRFHSFLLKLPQTIAQGRRISHAPPCENPEIQHDSVKITRTSTNIFPQLNPAPCEFHKEQKQSQRPGLPVHIQQE